MVWVPYREDSNVVWYQQVTSRSWYPADLPGQNWRKVAGIMQDMREHTVEEDVITYSSDACWRFRYSFNAFNRDCFESPLCNLSGFFGDITFQFGWRQNLDQWSIQLWFNDDLCLAVGSATQRRKRFSQCIALIAKMQIGCSRGNCVRSDLLLPNHLGLSLAQLSIEKKQFWQAIVPMYLIPSSNIFLHLYLFIIVYPWSQAMNACSKSQLWTLALHLFQNLGASVLQGG